MTRGKKTFGNDQKVHYTANPRSPRRYPSRQESDVYQPVTVYLPKSMVEILKAKQTETELPIGRLITIALDNELDAPMAFHYPTELPDAKTYVPHSYAEDALKLADWLREHFPGGTGRDTILLCRRDFNIPERSTVKRALMELYESGAAFEYHPTKSKFPYARDYYFTVIGDVKEERWAKQKYLKVRERDGSQG